MRARFLKPYIIMKCRKCGEMLIADRGRYKTRKCSKCNYVNKLNKVVILKELDNLKDAELIIKFLKIPKEERAALYHDLLK
ncbi:MAG: DUF1922 domain-containing protein [Promethearchaeota archaeon]